MANTSGNYDDKYLKIKFYSGYDLSLKWKELFGLLLIKATNITHEFS